MSGRWAVIVEANKRMCAGSTTLACTFVGTDHLLHHGMHWKAQHPSKRKTIQWLQSCCLPPYGELHRGENTFQTTHALYHSSLRLWIRHLFLKHFWRTVFTLRAFLRCKDQCVWTPYEFWLGLLVLWPPKPPNVPFSQGQPVARATGAIAMWGSFPAPFRRLHPDLTAPIVSDCWWQ